MSGHICIEFCSLYPNTVNTLEIIFAFPAGCLLAFTGLSAPTKREIVNRHTLCTCIRQKAKGKRQKAKGKRQKAKGKRQKAECNSHMPYVGLARTVSIRCICGISGRETTKYAVIYGLYIYGSGQP